MKSFKTAVHLMAAGIPFLLAAQPVLAAQSTQRFDPSFDLDRRLDCQAAIEETFWQARLWPAGSQDPKPAFETAVPRTALRERVESSSRQSNALFDLWQRPITPEMLQTEMNRMAKETRQPEMLRALFAALGNDPFLVAECLARPALAERLLHTWQGGDDRFTNSGEPFRNWWDDNKAGFSAVLDAPLYDYSLPAIEGTAAADDTWVDSPSIPNSTSAPAVWTGSAMLFWGGANNASFGKENYGWSYNPATDTWATLSNVNAPEPRAAHTAIWTGTEMIVWGGCDRFNISFCATSSGGRYNPATDSWVPTSNFGAPSGNNGHSVVWTGSKMIVWGGCTDAEHCFDTNTGGVYDPVTDSWTSTSLSGAPSARTDHSAVWSGSEMIVWGGWDGIAVVGDGARYNPGTGTWQPVSGSGAPSARLYHTAVWAVGDGPAGEMTVWGGCSTTICIFGQGSFFNSGARYNPASNTWTAVNTAGAPVARAMQSGVWTGGELLVWGGLDAGGPLGSGGRYNRVSNTWSTINPAGASPRSSHRAVWTGAEMIVWGGTARSGERYSPAINSWVTVNAGDPYALRADHKSIWTGTEMIAWGGSDTPWGTFYGSGNIYTPATATWRDTSLIGAPVGRIGHTVVWTGTRMIVWGGQDGSTPYNTGGRYDPSTDTWQTTSTVGAPAARGYHTAVFGGGRMIVWGGTGNTSYLNTGGAYNAVQNRWVTLPAAGAPAGRYIHTAVWTGKDMIVWGGVGAAGYLNSGGRFNVATRSWTAMSLTGAPTGRYFTSSVWTGSVMLIWGGRSGTVDNPTHFSSGGRYNPTSNTWTATAAVPGLEPRSEVTAVWTGKEMIVWGGWSGQTVSQGFSITGGRYDPAANTWRLTNLAGAPSSRTKHTAVWTGTDMIIWGGSESGYLGTGGRYFATAP